MQLVRYLVPLVLACASSATQSAPTAGVVDRALALVGDSNRARSSSDYAAARSNAAEAASLLLAETESARDSAWLEALNSAAHAAWDSQDAQTSSRAWRVVVDIRARTLPDQVTELQKARNNLAVALNSLGDLAGARDQLQQVVELNERLLPADDPVLQSTRLNLGATLFALGDLAGAKVLLEKALAVCERTLSADDPTLQNARTNLGATLLTLGDTAGALQLFEQVLDVCSRTLPDDHPELQSARFNVATALQTRGDSARAKVLLEKCLAIGERTLPDDHPELQRTRLGYAAILKAYGDFAGARDLEERILEVQSRTLPDDHPDLQRARSSLAATLHELGDLERSRALDERVLEVRLRTLSEDNPDLQSTRNNLATTLSEMGDATRARLLLEQAVEICSRTLPDDDMLLQSARENLAAELSDAGELEDARRIQEQVLEARERTLPQDDIQVQRARTNLGCTLLQLDDAVAAQKLFATVVESYVRFLPPGQPRIQRARMNLAAADQALGELETARELLEVSLDSLERALPEGHWLLQDARENLATNRGRQIARASRAAEYDAVHRESDREACAALVRAACRAAVRAAHEAVAASAGREAEERCVALVRQLNLAISFARGYGVTEPIHELDEEAFLVSETTRGAGLVAAQITRSAAGVPQYAALRAELKRASLSLADVAQEGTTSEEFDRAQAKRESVERQLKALAREQPAALEFNVAALAAQLEPDEAAVSFRRYEAKQAYVVDGGTPDVRQRLEDHLCAFVLRKGLGAASPIRLIDLGSIEPIESAVGAWRTAVGARIERGMAASDPEDDAAKESGDALRRLVLDPLLPAIGEAHRIVVALDDVLHLVPLDALPLSEAASDPLNVGDRWHIETRATLSELLTGSPELDGGVLVALGGASFNVAPAALADEEPVSVAAGIDDHQPAQVATILRRTTWERGFAPLSYAADEARGVGALYEEVYDGERPVIVLEKRKASRASLQELAPKARYLHLATHGWFAPQSIASWNDPEPLDKYTGLGSRSSNAQRVEGMSPMLLCGLAFAGANLREDAVGRAPGIVTADELSTFDLSNCELAVLSACDTNVGERRAGQGVASLQKALQMAGARSVITSLWKVPDEATKELMLDFYRRLWVEKKPKWQALWEAKTKLREAKDERGAPKYTTRDWAAWVLTGNPD